MSQATIALLGQPNSGKSTIFNQLTGSRQHVGNWPGKTVEKKDGTYTYKHVSGSTLKFPVGQKWHKIPSKVVFKKK